jgi:hypothetical protein
VNRILVVGAPRSGTTWLAATLAATPGSSSLHEPDNVVFSPAAKDSAREYGGYPVLHPREPAPAYEKLWDPGFGDHGKRARTGPPAAWRFGHRKNGTGLTSVVAKSVFAAFALDWLAERYAPQVVLIERNPIDVVFSWMRLDFVVGDLATRERIRSEYIEPLGLPRWDADAPRLLQVSWAVGVLMSAMRHQSRMRPAWKVVSHEAVSRHPSILRHLAASVGLRWSPEAESVALQRVEARSRPRDDALAVAEFLSQFPELESWLALAREARRASPSHGAVASRG